MTLKRSLFAVVGVLLLASVLLWGAGQAEPRTYRVFVAPVAGVMIAGGNDMTLDRWRDEKRFGYVVQFYNRRECNGIVPTSREDLADYTVWFESEALHYMLLWDAQGKLVGVREGVMKQGNIVKDVCNAIRKHVSE